MQFFRYQLEHHKNIPLAEIKVPNTPRGFGSLEAILRSFEGQSVNFFESLM